MKKYITVNRNIVWLLLILLMLGGCSHSEKIKKDEQLSNIEKINLFKDVSDYYTVENCPALQQSVKKYIENTILLDKEIGKKKKDVHRSESDENELYKKIILATILDPSFNDLEKASLNNDECGAASLSFLSLIYSSPSLDEKEKNKETQKRLLDFASTNNSRAVFEVCIDDKNPLIPTDVRAKFCELVFNDSKSPDFKKIPFANMKDWVGWLLSQAYYETKQIEKLTVLCEKSKGLKYENSCYDNLKSLADDLNKDKSYLQASIPYEKLIRFWENVYYQNNVTPKDDYVSADDYKKNAYRMLKDLYFKTKNSKKLVNLCQDDISNDDKYCRFTIYELADELYKKNEYEQAYQLYSKAVDDGSGLAENKLGEMNLNGEGVHKNFLLAIEWYQKALYSTDQHSQDFRTEILNQMGVAYMEAHDYLNAFNNYHEAAKLGDAVSQLNLAGLYFRGLGTLGDIKQAYAWVSIAATRGLQDENLQFKADYLRSYLISLLLRDRTGNDLREAQLLEKKYYREYVLQKEPTTIQN